MREPKDDPSSIGNILIVMGLVTPEQVAQIREEQAHMREDILIGNLMVAKGWITREQLELALAAQTGLRNGGRNGQALAVANESLRRMEDEKERRTRMIEKGARAEAHFLSLVRVR